MNSAAIMPDWDASPNRLEETNRKLAISGTSLYRAAADPPVAFAQTDGDWTFVR
jgi:hypothetical protein